MNYVAKILADLERSDDDAWIDEDFKDDWIPLVFNVFKFHLK